jgi:hypothetical protein
LADCRNDLPSIPLTFSIANGLAFRITAYALIKLIRGRITRTDWLLLGLSALFVARFVWLSAGDFRYRRIRIWSAGGSST